MSIGGSLKQKGHIYATNAQALRAMVRMYKVSREAQGMKDEEAAKLMQKDMATFLEGAWYVSVVDVESTLRHVCKKVLTDSSLGKEARKKRAKGLKRVRQSPQPTARAHGSRVPPLRHTCQL